MPIASESRPTTSPHGAAQASAEPGRFAREMSWLVALPAVLGTVCAAAALGLAWWTLSPGSGRTLVAIVTVLTLGGAVAITWWARARARQLAARYLATHAHLEREARAAAGSEARLAGVIGSAMDAIITVDRDERVIVFNEMAEKTFGWSAAEMVGQRLDRLLPERFRQAHARHVTGYALTGESNRSMGHPGQLLARRRDGSEFPIEATLSKVTVAGELLLTVILRDVSERVRAEEAQRRQSERLARYARRLEGLQEIDRAILASRELDELFVAALQRLAPLLRADEVSASVIGDNGDAVQHRVLPGATPPASVHVRPAGTSQSVDEWIATEGGLAVVDDLASPHRDASGLAGERHDSDYRSYLGVALRSETTLLGRLEAWARAPGLFDEEAKEVALEVARQLAIAIERTQMREDLRRHASHLEARVAERTRALQDVNAELNAFAYSVSHDLRAPLRSTQGFAQALLEDYSPCLDEAGRDYANRIVAASRRMDDLIQDLLAYSRLSRAEVELQPVDLGRIADTAASVVSDLAQPARPVIEIHAPLPPVVGHAGVLAQVLQNLLGNAVKFVAPGTEPYVRVSAESRDGRVLVSVEDNGIGIPPEYEERIFRVFERLHPLEAYPGTGIGLAIVRKGVERLGGRCGVESREGRGSRFWFDLPAAPPGSLVAED